MCFPGLSRADVDCRNQSGWIPLANLNILSDPQLVRPFLSASSDPNQKASLGNAIHDSILFHNLTIVRILLSYGADINAVEGPIPMTPLDVASHFNKGQVVINLIKIYDGN